MDSEQAAEEIEEGGLILVLHLSQLSLYLHLEQCASAQHFHPVDCGDNFQYLSILESTIEHHH